MTSGLLLFFTGIELFLVYNNLINISFNSIISVIKSDDFCDAFRGNGHKVDLSFQLFSEWPRKQSKEFLIIGNQYWVLSLNPNDSQRISFDLNETSNEWSESGYRLA